MTEIEELVDVAAMTEKEKSLIPEARRLIEEILENGPPGETVEDRSYLQTPFAKRALEDDWVVVKYLRLAHHKPKNVATLFHATLKWRQEADIDGSQHKRYPKYKEMKKYFPFGWHGTTKYGHPIHYDCPGYLQVEPLMKIVTLDELVDYHVAVQEYMANDLMQSQTEKTGRRIHQIFVIIDCQNAGRAQMTNVVRNYLQRTSILDQQHYPDAMVRMFIINAPWIFSAFWKLLKVFLNERTRNKTHIYGSDYMKHLSEFIDEDQLPTFAGGKCPHNCTPQTFLQCHSLETNLRDRVLSPPTPTHTETDAKESAAADTQVEISSSSSPSSSSSEKARKKSSNSEVEGSPPDFEAQTGETAAPTTTLPSQSVPHSSPPAMSSGQPIAAAS